MSTSTPTINFSNTTDAQFRIWSKAVSDALLAVGLVRTTDTGQINFTTVLRSAAANGVGGYEIFRFNDAAQAGAPVFIKMEYGNSNQGATVPGFWITVGTATDGAGNIISGLQIVRRQVSFSTANTNNNPCYFSGDGSYFAMLLPFTGASLAIVMERTRTITGVATTDGVTLWSISVNNASTNAVMSFLNYSVTVSSYPNMLVPGSAFGTALVGADVYYFARQEPLPKVNYDLSLMTAYTADVIDLGTLSIPNLGSNHTYMVFKAIAPTTVGGFSALVRYE